MKNEDIILFRVRFERKFYKKSWAVAKKNLFHILFWGECCYLKTVAVWVTVNCIINNLKF